MAKSSQAARSSRLSTARRSASRRRQAGSTLKNVNLAKVRSAIGLTIVVALGLGAGIGWGAPLNFFGGAAMAAPRPVDEKVQDVPSPTRSPSRNADQGPSSTQVARSPAHVTVVLVPSGASVGELSREGRAVGLLSAGLGSVPAEQTDLDVTQGNRVFDSLYDEKLPTSRRCTPQWWKAVTKRADSAPADIVPGLLASTLESAGIGV